MAELSGPEIGASAAEGSGADTSAAGLGAASLDEPAAKDADPGDDESSKSCKTCKKKDKKKRKRSAADLKKDLAAQRKMLLDKQAELNRWDDDAKADARKWFGSDSDETRASLQDRVGKELALKDQMSKNPDAFFQDADPSNPNRYAYVYPADTTHQVYLDSQYYSAPLTGEDSRAGALSHEMSHFNDIGGTRDFAYGSTNALGLAQSNPGDALRNADNFEYYLEKGGK